MKLTSPLAFDNSFRRELPGDPRNAPADHVQPRQVTGAAWSDASPTPVAAPSLIAWSPEVAVQLGLPEVAPDGMADVLSGNRLLPGMAPWASCYGGHQFGNWAGQLGDGRAISLGEVVHDGQRFEMQLKGAGRTPYSRGADGRAVLRSSVREFLCSEAMFHLGVPTTRALSLVTTGDDVVRDMFYDGNPKPEPGAIVCRVAPSFIRFGNFEIFASRQDTDTLRKLAEHTLARHYPELGAPGPDTFAEWVAEVARRTAFMVAQWMRVGFVHGVMNTDNMSVLGLTIDYGPYGWIDNVDPDWTPNTTDAGTRRYRFGQQPAIAGWNLARFASAIHPLVGHVEPLQEALDVYVPTLTRELQAVHAAKLGFSTYRPDSDDALVSELGAILTLIEMDMTIFYRRLVELEPHTGLTEAADLALIEPLMAAAYPDVRPDYFVDRLATWCRRYLARSETDPDPSGRRARMQEANPAVVLRNYIAQQAIDDAEQGNIATITELLDVLRRPYADLDARSERFGQRRPEWARHRAGCSMLSCSS